MAAPKNLLHRHEYDGFVQPSPSSGRPTYLEQLLLKGAAPHEIYSHLKTIDHNAKCIDLSQKLSQKLSRPATAKELLNTCIDSQCSGCPARKSKSVEVSDDCNVGDKVSNSTPKSSNTPQSSGKKASSKSKRLNISKQKLSDIDSEDEFEMTPKFTKTPKSSGKKVSSKSTSLNIPKRKLSDGSEDEFDISTPKFRKLSQASDRKSMTSCSYKILKNKSSAKHPSKSKINSTKTLNTGPHILENILIRPADENTSPGERRRDNSNLGGFQTPQLSGVVNLDNTFDEGVSSMSPSLHPKGRKFTLNLLKGICEDMSTGAGPSSVSNVLPQEEINSAAVAQSSSDTGVELCLNSLEKYNVDGSLCVSQSLLNTAFLAETHEELVDQNSGKNCNFMTNENVAQNSISGNTVAPPQNLLNTKFLGRDCSFISGEGSDGEAVSEDVSPDAPSDDEEISCAQKPNSKQLSLQVSKVSGETVHQSSSLDHFVTNDIPDLVKGETTQAERENFNNLVNGVTQSNNPNHTIPPVENAGGLSSLEDRDLFKKVYDSHIDIIKSKKNINDVRFELARRAYRKANNKLDVDILQLEARIDRL